MTSSPHRQEILSSSLEAFQRIQLELACKQAGITAERFTSSSSGEIVGTLSNLTTASATVGNISLKVESQVKLSDTSEKKLPVRSKVGMHLSQVNHIHKVHHQILLGVGEVH
jgi:hypothetical protein